MDTHCESVVGTIGALTEFFSQPITPLKGYYASHSEF